MLLIYLEDGKWMAKYDWILVSFQSIMSDFDLLRTSNRDLLHKIECFEKNLTDLQILSRNLRI
jgi:hypothetical protein